MNMQRLSITIDEDLASEFDELIAKRGYQNRSEAFRDLLRKELTEEKLLDLSNQCVAVISYSYDHNKLRLSEKTVEHQHHHLDMVISSMHVHASHNMCVETVIARGTYKEIKKFAEHTISEKGVKDGKFNIIPLDEY